VQFYQFVMNTAPHRTLLSSREAGAQAANDKCSWRFLRSNSGGSGSGSSQTRMPPTSLGIAARWKEPAIHHVADGRRSDGPERSYSGMNDAQRLFWSS
jgi:hypothetical protein